MAKGNNRFNVFVVVLTFCLAATLTVVLTVKNKPIKQAETDTTTLFLPAIDVKTSRADLESDSQLLMDATWEEMRFILSGVEYALPLNVSELIDHNWKGFNDEFVEAGEKASFEAYNGNASIKGELYNDSDSDKKVSKCKIIKISFTWANGVLPQNIGIMRSNISDVYERYGEPLVDDKEKKCATYETIDYSKGFEAFTDENRPGVTFFYDDEGVIVFAELYCGSFDKEAEK